jgi:hypothetical protein
MNVLSFSPVIFLTVMLTSSGEASGQHDPKDSVTITSIIQEKKSRSPLEQKIDSRLLQVVKQEQTRKQSGATDFSQVNADPAGNLEVDITAEVTDELLAKIKKLGGRILFPSAKYRSIRAIIHLSSVKTIAGYPEVKFIKPAAIAQTNSPGGNMNPGNPAQTEKINPNPQPAAGKKQDS